MIWLAIATCVYTETHCSTDAFVLRCRDQADGREDAGTRIAVPNITFLVNLIKRWFKELTDKGQRRGAFSNVAEVIEAITTWGPHWDR